MDSELLSSKLADVRYCQCRLLGRMESLGFDLKREASLNTVLSDVIKSSAIEGFMNTFKYAKMAKCSNDTALRDIHELKERNIFIKNPGGGRSPSYRLPDR